MTGGFAFFQNFIPTTADDRMLCIFTQFVCRIDDRMFSIFTQFLWFHTKLCYELVPELKTKAFFIVLTVLLPRECWGIALQNSLAFSFTFFSLIFWKSWTEMFLSLETCHKSILLILQQCSPTIRLYCIKSGNKSFQ